MTRILLLTLALLCGTRPAFAAITALTGTAASSGDASNVTTGSIDTSGANLLVLVIASAEVVATPTVSDSKSNTWTPLTEYSATAALRVRIYYVLGGTVGSGHTFTLACSLCYPAVAVRSFSGVKTASAFGAENGFATASLVSSIQPGSLSPSENDMVLVTGLAWASTGISIGSSFVITSTTTELVGGFAYGVGLGYKIQTTAGAEDPSWSWSGSTAQASSSMATFKSEPAGGGTGPKAGSLSSQGIGK